MSIPLSRRAFLRGTISAALAAPYVLRTRRAVGAALESRYPQGVVRLIGECTVVDMLNQFLYRTDKESTLNDWLSIHRTFP